MTRNIYRRGKWSGTASGDLIKDFVETTAELAAVPVLDTTHGCITTVLDENAIYIYHRYSTDTADASLVIEPDSGAPGRWIQLNFAPSSTYSHDWIDKTIIPAGRSVVAKAGEDPYGVASDEGFIEIRRKIIDVEGTLDVGDNCYVLLDDDANNPITFLRKTSPPETDADHGAVFASDGTCGREEGFFYYRFPDNGSIIPISIQKDYVSLTSDHTLDGTEHIIGLQTSMGAIEVTLPSAQDVFPGTTVYFRDEDGAASTDNVTLTASGSDTIDGSATLVLSTNSGTVKIYTNGVDSWFTLD